MLTLPQPPMATALARSLETLRRRSAEVFAARLAELSPQQKGALTGWEQAFREGR